MSVWPKGNEDTGGKIPRVPLGMTINVNVKPKIHEIFLCPILLRVGAARTNTLTLALFRKRARV